MPTHNQAQRSRRKHNGWPQPAEVGAVYTLCFARALGSPADPRGKAKHYTGFSLEDCLAARLAAHWDGTCGVAIVVAFRRAGIPFAVVTVEHGVTRARENQLKLRAAARRCLVCCGQAVDRAATLLTEQAQTETRMAAMTLTEQEHEVLRAIGADSTELGITPGAIVRATAGSPHRVWTAQQAGRVARRLVYRGYVRIASFPKATYYRASSMGRGYLSVEDPEQPAVVDGHLAITKTGRVLTEGELTGLAAEAEEGYNLTERSE